MVRLSISQKHLLIRVVNGQMKQMLGMVTGELMQTMTNIQKETIIQVHTLQVLTVELLVVELSHRLTL